MNAVTWWAMAAGAWMAWVARPRPPARRPGDAPVSRDAAALPGARADRDGCPPRRLRRPRRRRRPPADRTERLAAWCTDVARQLRAGESLAAAVGQAPRPDDAKLADAIAPVERGEPPGRDTGVDRDLALVLSVLTAVVVHGGPAAEPLDRAAAVLRSRAALEAEAHTQSAQARWSAQVMTALPSGMLMVLVATSASVRSAVTSPAGTVVVVAGVLLNGVGWWWLRHLLTRPTA